MASHVVQHQDMEAGSKQVMPRLDSHVGIVDVDELCGTDGLLGELGKRIKAADKNGDGRLSRAEFRAVFQSEIKALQRVRIMRTVLLVVVAASFIIIGANVGLSVAVAQLTKDIKVNGAMLVAKDNQHIPLGTSQAVAVSNLSQAYLLNANALAEIRKVTLDMSNKTGATTLLVTYHVAAVAVTPNTSVIFITELGDLIIVNAKGVSFNTTSAATGAIAPMTSPATRHLLQNCGGSTTGVNLPYIPTPGVLSTVTYPMTAPTPTYPTTTYPTTTYPTTTYPTTTYPTTTYPTTTYPTTTYPNYP